jgi:hypothetical protein
MRRPIRGGGGRDGNDGGSIKTAAAVMTTVEKAAVDITDGKDGGR